MANSKTLKHSPFACLPPLLDPNDTDIQKPLGRLEQLVGQAPRVGTLQVSVLDASGWKHGTIHVGAACVAPKNSPDVLQILVRQAVFDAIAGGTLSPLKAFATGQLRARGAHGLGLAIVKHLAIGPVRLSVCGE